MTGDRSVGRLRAVGALVLLLGLVVGAPAAILAAFGWPLTRAALDVRRWPQALTGGQLSDDAIGRVLVTAALLVLAYLLGCALAEVTALVRRTDRSTRGRNPLSHGIRHLVAVAAVLVTTARPAVAVPGPPASAPRTTLIVAPPSAYAGTSGLQGLPTPVDGLGVTASGEVVHARDAAPGTVVVEAGRRDTLYSIAVRHLGDGDRRDELVALNQGRRMVDGTTFDGIVRPGYRIVIPAGAETATSTAAPPAAADERTYEVVPGDDLWSIAERFLGDGAAYHTIHQANLGREVAPGVAYLSTTQVLRPGWSLVIPAPVAASAMSAADTGGDLHEVRAGESVWSIAEQRLSAGRDGPVPADEVSAYVADTVAANADVFARPGHPELVFPGQQLRLPPRSPVAPEPPAVAPPAAADGRAARPLVAGDPSAPETPGEPAPEGPAAVPAAAGVVADGADDATVVETGGRPGLPAPLPPPVAAAVAPAPSVLPPAGSGAAREPAQQAAAETDDPAPGPSVPGLAGAAVLAAGAVGVVLRLRHQRLNRRRPGHRIEAPTAAASVLERVLRIEAEAELARWAPRALRHLAPRLGTEWDGSFPLVTDVALRPTHLEVVWSAPRPTVVTPWRASADGRRWSLDRGASVLVPDGVVPPCPGLVTVGRQDAVPILLDVESAGLVAVRGAPERVAAFGRAMVLELAVSDFADLLDIRLVGLPADGFEHLHRVHAVASLDQALAWARPVRAGTDELLAEQGARSLFELRARQRATAVTHEPLVLVVAPGLLDAGAAAELGRLCQPGRGVVAVVLGPVPAPVTIELQADGRAELHRADPDAPVGGAPVAGAGPLDPPQLPAATLAAVAALLAHAAEAEEHPEPVALPPRRSAPFEEPPVAVEVRLFGPVAVGDPGGGDWDGLAPRTLEVIAWLATHRGAEPASRLRADVWAGREGSARSLNRHLAIARTRLGAGPDGALLLPAGVGDHHRLSDAVVTDVARLEARVGWAATADDAAAVGVLREGLTLVRGRPFTARSGYGWANADQLVFRAEQLVVDAAHRLAVLALAAQDPDAAVWATTVGLRGRPGDETLYQLRMRAFGVMGNRGSVRSAMNELCAQLQDLAGVDEPSDETAELYEQLMGRERSA